MTTISIELTEEEAETLAVAAGVHAAKLHKTIVECTEVSNSIRETIINQQANVESAYEKIRKAIYRP